MKQVGYTAISILVFALLVGCSATSLNPGAELVELVDVEPDKLNCDFLGEVVGSQGGWFTGDYTSNANLMIGARNDLRNKAYQLGGNTVFVVLLESSKNWKTGESSNTFIIGNVYRCIK